jgi:hypothetical protein
MGTLMAALPIHSEERRGEPVRLHGRTIAPIARVTRVRWRGGVWEWHRPVAVEVREGETLSRMPIRDPSRVITVALAAIGCAVALGALRRFGARRMNER